MLDDEGVQAAFGVDAGLFAFFLVGEIDEEFDGASVVAFGDGVVEGVDEDAPFADT